MKEQLENLLRVTLDTLGFVDSSVQVNYPKEPGHGDCMSSVALGLAKATGKKPMQIAESITLEIQKNIPAYLEKVEIAGPGFINFYLTRDYYAGIVEKVLHDSSFFYTNTLKGKKVIIEYTQPNPFKPFHIGHLMSNTIGESLSRLLAACGADVTRLNYQGDIGPHVAKAMYGIIKNGKGIVGDTVVEKADYIGECYAYGSDLYENDEAAKKEIDELNKKIYQGDSETKALYDEGRKITLLAFEELYRILGTSFDHYYFESEMVDRGRELVHEYEKKGVFESSDGAIVFHAEKYNPNLHTRVFITKHDTPTYETKELALTETKFKTYNPDLSIVTTAVEQQEYMKVLTEAISQMFKNEHYAERMEHITHGMMRFASGKMSSRKGNVVTGESLVRDAKDAVLNIIKERDYSGEMKERIAEEVGVAAIKYSILRGGIGSDIIFDFEKSISFDGDSGPYLQYTTARANAVLAKASDAGIKHDLSVPTDATLPLERLLERFPKILVRATEEREPHHLTTYLIQLAGEFNSFYGNEQIIKEGDIATPFKLAVTEAVSKTLSNGLVLLGIKVPEKM